MNTTAMHFFASFLALTCLTSTSAYALDTPTGEVILTVTGAHISQPNAGDTAQFDIAMLEKLVGRSGTMETPWTKGKITFSGPLLKSILEAAGAEGTKLRVKALNDYAAEIPINDATEIDTMLATRMNGETMSIRDKGPLFLIYPFDIDSSLYNEKYFSRSVWQIKEIEVTH